MELAPEAKPKTAFTIGMGLWQFRVMPSGHCNASATFFRLMEQVLWQVSPAVAVWCIWMTWITRL